MSNRIRVVADGKKACFVDEKGRKYGNIFFFKVSEDKSILYYWNGGTYVYQCSKAERFPFVKGAESTDYVEYDVFSSELWGNGVFESEEQRKVRMEKELPYVVASVERRMQEGMVS